MADTISERLADALIVVGIFAAKTAVALYGANALLIG